MVRNFLFSWLNREFLIFLFFLVLSGCFWLLTTLNETCEREISVPVRMAGVPQNAVIIKEMEDTLRVTVRDKGFALAAYFYGDGIRPIVIPFGSYANRGTGYGAVPAADVSKYVAQRFLGSTKVVQIKPDRLDFYFNFGQSRKVPVRMTGHVAPSKAYYLARTHFWPETVTLYASRKVLDSLQYVNTMPIEIVNFSDTVVKTVSLQPVKGVKMVPSQVRITLYPDILTEEDIEVPVRAENMPDGKVLRTFPSKVKVRFVVGASMFRNINADQFAVVVDYNEIVSSTSSKCRVYLKSFPSGVRNARQMIDSVDYVIEEQ